MNEPIADAVRSILDGHIVLSRALAARNHYPCIDVLHSASRLFSQIAAREQEAAAGRVRELLATYERSEDLINIGAYQKGSNPTVDEAILHHDSIVSFLRQDRREAVTFPEAVERMVREFDSPSLA